MKMKTRISVLLLWLSIVLNALHVVTANEAGSFLLLLGCGSDSAQPDYEGRKWEPDSRYLVKDDNTVTNTASFQDPSLPTTVPYMTARIFTTESSYSVKVAPNKRHWLRLHFYPSTYGNFNPDDAYFRVVANGVTLLKNFSASITASALTQAYLIKEFSLSAVSSGTIDIIFTPTPEHKGSYAFVNGIEVISTPELFEQDATMVGLSDQTIAPVSSIMQTMYRLNVGGQFIAASNDSSLTRTWYDDLPYISGGGVGVTDEEFKSKIEYSHDVPEYIAPSDVYLTYRQMGPDPKVNRNYNLTWQFQVDANFTYILRLHFCELAYTENNQRVFDIYINNQTAFSGFDIIALSGGKYKPYYKDFAIYVSDLPGDENLFVAIHPNDDSKPEVLDGALNGMEIFKLNDTAGNLAGPNPVPSIMLLDDMVEDRTPTQPKGSNHTRIIGGAAGGAAAVGLVTAICFAVYQRKKREFGSDSGSGWLPLYGGSYRSNSKSTISGKSSHSSTLSTLAAGLCRHFSLAEITHGTKNFDESYVIGVGGFGKVYKGVVDGGLKVAIKRSNPSSEQGVHEFRTEIEMLSKLRHRHLVSLIGFCEENDEMILVYDYMSHGTLREHLYKGNKITLSWKQRLEILIGAARGLHYLHTGAKYTIIHRDVKTTNILVDENWVAKVSDFGLSKTGPTLNESHVSTVVKGSFGYLDPEYFRRQQLTEKSDVYSFGVVLFEVLTARPALNPSLPKEQVSLADWALRCQQKGVLEDIIDPTLKGKINPECLKKFADTAEKCLLDHGMDRPSMGDVLWNLEFALQLQENPGGAKVSEEPKPSKPASVSAHEATLSLPELTISEEDENMDPTSPFSMMVKQEGR